MELFLDGITKAFKGQRAVDKLSLHIHEGEFFAILGPSGCGKTTTLRCIVGFEKPDEGEIRIGPSVVSSPALGIHTPPNKRNIGMVFQSYAIWPHMTVFENVSYGLRMRRTPTGEIRPRVSQMLELVGLAGFESRMASQLSGGQMQRVALARSLVLNPKILLLDEPLSNLDARLRDRLRFELKEIQLRTKITTIYVTHDQTEAVVLGDRIAVMNHGQIVQLGTPRELYEQPVNAFVADFLGSTNMLEGTTKPEKSPKLIRVEVAPGFEIVSKIKIPTQMGTTTGSGVRVSIRPERATLSTSPPQQDINVWSAEVVVPQFMGTYTRYLVEIAGHRLTVICSEGRSDFKPGQRVFMHADPSTVDVFPA